MPYEALAVAIVTLIGDVVKRDTTIIEGADPATRVQLAAQLAEREQRLLDFWAPLVNLLVNLMKPKD
jgi:hypothetical protein